VSWQVTGIRQDDYAKEHRMVVEVPKDANEAGGRQFVPKGSNARQRGVGPVDGPDPIATRMPAAPLAPRSLP
jgi:hypothetical protein